MMAEGEDEGLAAEAAAGTCSIVQHESTMFSELKLSVDVDDSMELITVDH